MRSLRDYLGPGGRVLENGIRVLRKCTQRYLLPSFFTMQRYKEKVSAINQKKRPHRNCGVVILATKAVRNSSCLSVTQPWYSLNGLKQVAIRKTCSFLGNWTSPLLISDLQGRGQGSTGHPTTWPVIYSTMAILWKPNKTLEARQLDRFLVEHSGQELFPLA